VSSGGQYGVRIPAGDLESDRTRYRKVNVYCRTKREQVVLTREWARRLAGEGVFVHAMHPGWALTPGIRQWMPVFQAVSRPLIRTPEQAADTIVWLGSAPEAIQSAGELWQDRRVRPAIYRLGPGPDAAAAVRQLWDYTAALAAVLGAGPPGKAPTASESRARQLVRQLPADRRPRPGCLITGFVRRRAGQRGHAKRERTADRPEEDPRVAASSWPQVVVSTSAAWDKELRCPGRPRLRGSLFRGRPAG
jgi:hypothetical protein